MTHKTHVTFSINAFLLPVVSYAYLTNNSIDIVQFNAVASGVVLGSLLPDIDEPQSRIGKRTMGISNIIKAIFGHRGATHYLIAPLIILLLALFVYQSNQIYGLFTLGVSYGYLFHLFGDMMTISGIRRFFYPFGKKKPYWILPKKLRFYTNSFKEHVLNAALTALLGGQIYLLYILEGFK